jgi:trans-aconitate 2-methyltransferase
MTEWDAEAYSERASLQRWLAEKRLAGLVLRGDEHVLDVGCGDGRITAQIAQRVEGGSVLGVDPSEHMIAFAARTWATTEHPNLRFEVGDARSISYDAIFDVVVSFNALHWVPEQEAALRSIRRALRSDGRAILQLVPEADRRSLEDVLEDTRSAPRWAAFFEAFRKPYVHPTEAEYRRLADACGFAVERIVIDDVVWDFHSRDLFTSFGHATFVEWTRMIPPAQHDAFIADVLERYRVVSGDATSFKFYQMEVVLSAR